MPRITSYNVCYTKLLRIHPIGREKRKGKNNSLNPSPDDVALDVDRGPFPGLRIAALGMQQVRP